MVETQHPAALEILAGFGCTSSAPKMSIVKLALIHPVACDRDARCTPTLMNPEVE